MERITQMYSAFGWHLKGNLMRKYNLRVAKNMKEPCLFFGCYGSQIEKALKWADKAKVVIWWSGSDITYVFRNNSHADTVRNHPNISHIATVNFIERDLQRLNFKYKKIPLVSQFIDDFSPCPLGDSIYTYKSRIYIKRDKLEKIKAAFPNTPFIMTESHRDLTQDQIREAYKNSFLSFRMLVHDGLSHTVCEMGLMGRKVIYNGDTPNAVNFTDISDAIEKARQIEEFKYDPYTVAKEMHDYLNVGDNWLNTKYYD